MKLLHKILLTASVAASATLANATVTFGSSALSGVSFIAVGDVGVLVIDNDSTDGFDFSSINLIAGTSITANATYSTNFSVALNISKTANVAGIMSGSFPAIPIDGNAAVAPSQGDRFAYITFDNSTTTVLAGDTYRIWTDPTWVIPPDGNYNFQAAPTGLNFKQMGAASVAAFTKTVAASAVPEPSAFAALAGLSILGAVATRRRRSA